MIKILTSDLQAIFQQAQKTYPEECCGLLLGKININEKIITQVWPTKNNWNEAEEKILFPESLLKSSSKSNRFSINPQEFLKAQKSAHQQNLAIVSIYHSHPDHPAIPSEYDRTIAWDRYSYIIVSVVAGQITDYYSWILNENRQFQQEEIKML